jgi:serine/threonine protein phosphatase PrpC
MSPSRRIGLAAASATRSGAECFGVNDDRAIVDSECSLYLVADGAGPTYGGYYAPIGMDLAIETIRDAVGGALLGVDGEARLRTAFAAAHARCGALEDEHRAAFEVELRRRGDDRLGASLAACRKVAARCGRPVDSFAHFAASITTLHVWGDEQLTVAQIGACRAYRLRRGMFDQLLPDHTLASAIAASGEKIDPETLAHFRLIPTKLLGMLHASEIELRTERTEPGDRYLLCTDGLWGHVDAVELGAVLGGDAAPTVIAATLVDLVAQRGAQRPHVTAVVVDVAGSAVS